MNIAQIKYFQLYFTAFPIDSAVGASLATVPVVDAVGAAVQLAPHAYPVGQHPPPTVSAQLNQPVAHVLALFS